ncbi:MAG: DUF4390 domain-containing protein [Syntrophaceae bacterium]|nr:DUF4390 domain-containing protein [Syntrophaceae bacterium]
MKKISLLTTVALILMTAVLATAAATAKPLIRDILVTTKGEQVLLYGKISDGFTPDMSAAVMAGFPVQFTFYAGIYQERSFWFDRRISDIEINRTLKYDNLKKTFQVSSDGGSEPAVFQTLGDAKVAMSDLNGFPVASVKALSKNTEYYMKVMAKLDRVRLPLRLEYVFLFVSLWDLETPWHTYRFIYRE